jgi:hypothetical protein
MQAIRTAYHGPTNHRPARIHAMCAAGHLTMNYADGLDQFGNHRQACAQLLLRLGWTTAEKYPPVVGGNFGGDIFWVFIRAEDMLTV